jgi:hypothetical protein
MQAKIVNQTMIHIFKHKLKLRTHLNALRNYALMYAGDTMDNLITLIYRGSGLNEYYVGNLTTAFDIAVKTSSKYADPLADNFKFANVNIGSKDEMISVGYNADWPLNIVLNDDVMHRYS